MRTEQVTLKARLGKVALVRMLPEPGQRAEKSADVATFEQKAEALRRDIDAMQKGLEAVEAARKGMREVDAANRAAWADSAKARLTASGLAAIEGRRLSCAEAASFLLEESPGDRKHADDWESATGATLSPRTLALWLAEASEAKRSQKPETDAARKSADVLSNAWDTAEAALKAARKPMAGTYSVFCRAARDVASGLIDANTAGLAVLQCALATLEPEA